MAKRLFIDMDGTLAKFHDEVNYLERMWEPGFFRNLQPFDNMIYAVKEFISQHPDVEVFILSSKIIGEPPYCEMEKNDWLDKYLPEVDAAHRLFPSVGTPKASSVEGGITEEDYLLDDYNKSLREWEAAGGSAIKCHNNINQHGLGTYGGGRGELWEGDMVHTRDRPELISAELSQHMQFAFDPRVAAGMYGEVIEQRQNRAGEDGWCARIATRLDEETGFYYNPLNAIRAAAGNRAFEEIPVLDAAGGKVTRLTKAELLDKALNLGIDGRLLPIYESDNKDWGDLLAHVLKAEADISAAENVESLEDFETLRQQAEHDDELDDEMEPD